MGWKPSGVVGLLEAFAQQIRLVRGRFGCYEPIDFLAVLISYAISGERILADFFERMAPFETALMALFGRAELPHRSSLSRFLADVDRPCLEAFRTLFQKQGLADGWTEETIGGIWDRQDRRYIVFDVDATREAATQRSLPIGPELPPARRRLDAVCAPGYRGRKRGEVVRTRTTVLQMRTRQWVGTYGGRGNGDYLGELTLALQAITAYLKHFAFSPEMALVRLDGHDARRGSGRSSHAGRSVCGDPWEKIPSPQSPPDPGCAGLASHIIAFCPIPGSQEEESMPAPQLTEAAIRQYASAESFERGSAYYEQGQVTSPVLRGTTLYAEVEGSEAFPYLVRCTCATGGSIEASCTCPYDWGGWCKHIVAVCLCLIHEPETIEERPRSNACSLTSIESRCSRFCSS
jgi:hypothetical protein